MCGASGFYLNGSDIKVSNGTYLATQGPLEHTVDDFWKAVLHRRSRVIVTLVMAKEEGFDKCSDCGGKKSDFLSFVRIGKLTFSVKKRSASIRKVISSLSAFQVSNEKLNEKHLVTQLHYENWPDQGIPDLLLFQQLFMK